MSKFSLISVYQLFNIPTAYYYIPQKGPLRTSQNPFRDVLEGFSYVSPRDCFGLFPKHSGGFVKTARLLRAFPETLRGFRRPR